MHADSQTPKTMVYTIRGEGDRPGPVAQWLSRRTHNLMIAGPNLTGASNILGQDMNPVNALQCCMSRGWQCVAPEVETHSDFETRRRRH